MKEEIISELNKLTSDEPEWAHQEAEDLLCKFLESRGYKDVADAFYEAKENVGFWYS